jgi:hypothetical protein
VGTLLEDAIFDEDTHWPEGFDPATHGALWLGSGVVLRGADLRGARLEYLRMEGADLANRRVTSRGSLFPRIRAGDCGPGLTWIMLLPGSTCSTKPMLLTEVSSRGRAADRACLGWGIIVETMGGASGAGWRPGPIRYAERTGGKAAAMEDAKKKKTNGGKDEDQILVTRAILHEVKANIRYGALLTDEQLLAWMQQMTGRPVKLVEEIPDDEDVVVICSPVPVVPGSRTGECSECGVTVYFSKNSPVNARKICTRCGPRLGH